MKKIISALILLLVFSICLSSICFATEEETTMTKTEKEFFSYIENPQTLPINFVYNNLYYKGFDKAYFTEVSKTQTTEGVKTSVVIEYEFMHGIYVTLDAAVYKDYDAYEWTVYFENRSKNDSKVFRIVNALDMDFSGKDARLKGILGDHENKYAPYDYDLTKEDVSFVSELGRATHVYFPYFNFETAEGGAIIALGWGGTWQADFKYDADTESTNIKGTGTVGLCTYLKPGEKIRTPLVALVKYEGIDEDAAMNKWRRFYIDCNMPYEDATNTEKVQPHDSVMLAYDTGRTNSDGSISEGYDTWYNSLSTIYEKGLTPDFRWFDAGWYIDPNGNTVTSNWSGTVGTWTLDQNKWPDDTFKESVDYAREHGTKTFMWFEPERVTMVDGLVKNYGYKKEWAIPKGDGVRYLNNLGIPECLDWTYGQIVTTLEQTGVDMYREDFNVDPYIYFDKYDAEQGENRDGITENLYVQGHYELWDRIIAYCAENGKCTYIDSCASGGGRNDLESMRRGVPFLRSDSDRTTIALRLAMTTSLTKWLPYTGAMAKESAGQLTNGNTDIYTLRATMLPKIAYQAAFYHEADTLDWDALLQSQEEWNVYKDYFYYDFYTLTPYYDVLNTRYWTAYMYFDGESGKGVLSAFRPVDCVADTCTVKFKGVEADKFYSLRDLDGVNSAEKVSGADLIAGYTITASNPRTAIVIYIDEIK